jgi:hypothetical protein
VERRSPALGVAQLAPNRNRGTSGVTAATYHTGPIEDLIPTATLSLPEACRRASYDSALTPFCDTDTLAKADRKSSKLVENISPVTVFGDHSIDVSSRAFLTT